MVSVTLVSWFSVSLERWSRLSLPAALLGCDADPPASTPCGRRGRGPSPVASSRRAAASGVRHRKRPGIHGLRTPDGCGAALSRGNRERVLRSRLAQAPCGLRRKACRVLVARPAQRPTPAQFAEMGAAARADRVPAQEGGRRGNSAAMGYRGVTTTWRNGSSPSLAVVTRWSLRSDICTTLRS